MTMPNMALSCTKTADCLKVLKETTLHSKNKLIESLEGLKTIFEEGRDISPSDTKLAFALLTNYIKKDLLCFPHAIPAISSLLRKPKLVECIPLPDQLSSALSLLQILKEFCASPGTETLKELCFNTLLAYPRDVIGSIITHNCSDVIQIIEVSKPKRKVKISKEICCFLQKLLKVLSAEEKMLFVQAGLSIWLSDLIPTVMMDSSVIPHYDMLLYMEFLETVTDTLVHLEYFDCKPWREEILPSVYNTQKYPSVIKSQLESGSTSWHRFWIVLVKLLKNQITRLFETYGTPINALLPVVEKAFKMDVANRCRAFQCWQNLIDNFFNESNESCLPKRIKLLLLPLKLNNAKVEATALAKLNTWWHLIRRYQPKLATCTDDAVILLFIYFIFGKKPDDKHPNAAGVGQLYDSVKNYGLDAFAKIVGHSNCKCPSNLPDLNGKILNNRLLATNLNDWLFALEKAIYFTHTLNKSNHPSCRASLPVVCIWKAFLQAIVDMPPNRVRKDMFNCLIDVLHSLAKTDKDSENYPSDVIFHLILTLCKSNANIAKILMTGNEQEMPLRKVMSTILNPGIEPVLKRYDTEKLSRLIKPLTDLIVESLNVDWLLQKLTPNETTVKIWTALVLSVKESKTLIPPKLLSELVMWPVKSMRLINDDKYAALTWYRMASLDVERICKTGLDQEIIKHLTEEENYNKMKYFRLCITICLLKYKLFNEQDNMHNLLDIFQTSTSEISDYRELGQAVPLLVDTIILMLSNLPLTKDTDKVEMVFDCAKNVMRTLLSEIKRCEIAADFPIDDNIIIMLKNLLNAVELEFKTSSYADAKVNLVDELKEQAASLDKESTLFKFIVTKIPALSISHTKRVHDSIIDSVNESTTNSPLKTTSSTNTVNKTIKEFTSPNIKKVVKKVKKKETSIVNTVMENNEEYVVVKSNWKFNPKRLTENQREKLNRKREDIPALYQDLSQSQDEFKLASWKTDSQDTTSNSDNSKSNISIPDNKAANILINNPSCALVPKIMENIQHLSTPKGVKSPKMSLKDRVLLNVRNLTEKSTPKIDTNVINVDELQIDNIPKTPLANKIDNANLVNSAPSSISTDRPSRMKRRPKKFDDVKLFDLKTNALCYIQTDKTDTNILKQSETDNAINAETTDITLDNSKNPVTEEIAVEVGVIENTKEVAVPQDDAQPSEITPIMPQELTNITQEKPVSEEKSDVQMVDNTQDIPIGNDVQNITINVNIQDCEKVNNINVLDNVPNNGCSTAEHEAKVIVLKTQSLKVKEAPSKATPKKVREIQILAIDTVEGNPFLQSPPTSRLRRKISPNNSKTGNEKISKTKRESKVYLKSDTKITNVANKSNKSKAETITPRKPKDNSKETFSSINQESSSINLEETHNSNSGKDTFENVHDSEDVIESSQDSTLTTISTKSTKATPKRVPVIAIERLVNLDTQDLLQDAISNSSLNKSANEDEKDDIELTQNKTSASNKNLSVLTENLDTEPATEGTVADDVIIVDNYQSPITISSEKPVGPETQELAEAATQPNDPADFIDMETDVIDTAEHTANNEGASLSATNETQGIIEINSEPVHPIAAYSDNNTDVCSPFKEDTQRKQDFLNNTSEISPIKVQSPDREKTPTREETSSDYLVVKLTSPVQSNGEPFDKGSPEFFTEDKVSPDKRDQSPPRVEVTVSNNGSPSTSLSLKKNRPQVMRTGGRAAHMLGLCVPESLNTLKNYEKAEEPKKANTSTPARRNLRVLYNAASDTSDVCENVEPENFLKFKKDLPSTDSSPAVPILKRKLIDIVDDAVISPANKRKRVSFHDPPTSSTVSVQKYIETGSKSPSSSSKLLERQSELHNPSRAHLKSPVRLDSSFVKLDTMLSKAVESFKESPADINDTNISMDVTPTVEVVITSELNDTEPICPDLVHCADSIQNIAKELSSPAMHELFVKEMQGKVDTVGDLAKMTEIEVNRLSIKAPKIQVAKKVLTDYAIKLASLQEANKPDVIVIDDDTVLATEMNVEMTEKSPTCGSDGSEKEIVTVSVVDMETVNKLQVAFTQTTVSNRDASMQADEIPTYNLVETLIQREDHIDRLIERMDRASMRTLCSRLPVNEIVKILEEKKPNMTVLSDLLRKRSNTRDKILHCCNMLKSIYDTDK